MENKLEKQELEKIQQFVDEYNILCIELGNLELIKLEIIDKIKVLKNKETEFDNELKSKYLGLKSIDLSNGDIEIAI